MSLPGPEQELISKRWLLTSSLYNKDNEIQRGKDEPKVTLRADPMFLGPLLSGVIASNSQTKDATSWRHYPHQNSGRVFIQRVFAYWRHLFRRLARCAPKGLPHLSWPASGPRLGLEELHPSTHPISFPMKLVVRPILSKEHFNTQCVSAVLCLFFEAGSSTDQADLKLTMQLRVILSKWTALGTQCLERVHTGYSICVSSLYFACILGMIMYMYVETFTKDPEIASVTSEFPHIVFEFLALIIAHSRCVPTAKGTC